MVRRRRIRRSCNEQEHTRGSVLVQRDLFFLGYRDALVRAQGAPDETDHFGKCSISRDDDVAASYVSEADISRLFDYRLFSDLDGSQRIK